MRMNRHVDDHDNPSMLWGFEPMSGYAHVRNAQQLIFGEEVYYPYNCFYGVGVGVALVLVV